MPSSDRYQELLNEIFSYYNQKNYLLCIKTGQDVLNHTPIKAQLQSILGLCYLNLNDITKAESHFQKSFEMDPYLSYGLLGYAYVDLIKNRTNAALFKYTRLVNLKKERKRSLKIINLIKQNSEDVYFFRNRNIYFFIPKKMPISLSFRFSFLKNIRLPNFANKKFWWFSSAIILTICLAFFSYFLYRDQFLERTTTNIQLKNDPLSHIYLFETNVVPTKFSTKEIADSFELMKKYIRRGRINEAIVIYNGVRDSNINLLLKEKFALLYSFIPKPNFATFKNTYSIEEQIGDVQFRNTYVKLLGVISKLKQLSNNQVVFNFTLIDKKDLLHTVEVFLENTQNIYIENNQQYELLAQCKGFDKRKKKVILNGLILRKSK